jgi:PAS domain S-box-containing protein
MFGNNTIGQKSNPVNGKGVHPHDHEPAYQELIDELYEAYVEYDLKGNMVCFNQAAIELGGRSRDELMNLSYRQYMDPDIAEKVRRVYQEVYRTGIPKRGFVNEIIHKDGRAITLEGFVSLIKENGQAVGFRGIWRDITERQKTQKKLADQRSRLEAIFESVKEGIVAVDSSGKAIRANRALETICGVALEAIIGRPVAETHALCSRSCHLMLQETLYSGVEIKECQIGCRRTDRPQQVVVISSSPLKNAKGASMGAVLVIRDITDLLGLENKLRERYRFQNLIGKSQKMREIYDLLENLANLETTVLITGESGTGKELVAKALHYTGKRSHRPFIKVNCSALTQSVLESELFGHVRGAFTGALKDRQGRFEMADGGTLLLDEIGDISPLTQLKLLRVLQEKEFERVGESTPRKVDVRVISATNRDLKEKVKNGEFREDLYYRLKVMEIALPALRERNEDVSLLVDHFCRLFDERMKKAVDGVSHEVLSRFMTYPWPGNVRELEHGLEHAFVLCNGRTIELAHLPEEIRDYIGPAHAPLRPKPGKKPLPAQEVLRALEKCNWNKARAARSLGIDRSTIHRKILQHHLYKAQV